MSATSTGPSPRPSADRPPRGADLAEACVREALVVVERSGVEALSLRDVARRLGVSHQAPYRHFASRDHLLAELLRRSFEDLADRLEARRRAPDPQADLAALGHAYLAHASEHPLAYRLMFGTPLPDPASHPEMAAAARRAFAVVREVVARAHGTTDPERLDVETLLVWGKVHGLASLPRVPAVAALQLDPTVIAAATDPGSAVLADELGG